MKCIWLLVLLAMSAPAEQVLQQDIGGEWRRSADDNPAYSQSGFDDSGWSLTKLPWENTPPDGKYWLRRRVEVPAWVDPSKLSLTLGSVAEGYEVFGNGQLIGALGGFSADRLVVARPTSFHIPNGIVRPGETLVVAIRLMKLDLGNSAFRNSREGPYWLTYDSNAPRDAGLSLLNAHWMRRSSDYVLAAVQLTLAVLLLLAWRSERKRKELLWLVAYLSLEAAASALTLRSMGPEATPWRWLILARVVNGAAMICLVEFVMSAFDSFSWWVRAATWTGALMVFTSGLAWFWLMAATGFCAVLSSQWRIIRGIGGLDRHLLSFLCLLVIAFKANRAGLVLIPNRVDIGHYSWSIHLVSLVVLASFISGILLRRLLADRREKERLASELEAARVIQQLLLREPALRDGTLQLDAVYSPAQEVGGDFYYVLDGEVVVLGDVAGKGLKAAMLVSLLVGVLRGISERAPGAILAALNRAVPGQMEGSFVTCCCVRFALDGQVTLANAGQLSPYLNGEEVAVAPGLPLGLVALDAYDETLVAIPPGGVLTLVSDGVVEAANAKGELFGFERTREISGKSAAEIAAAAQAWGQNDDITVVTIRRSVVVTVRRIASGQTRNSL